MAYNHLMIDIETLGTKSNSVILSIAAVNFDLETGNTGKTFYEKINIQTCLDCGLEICSETLNWWITKTPQNVCKDAFEGKVSLAKVLVDLWCFVKNLRQDEIELWGNSARFDLGLIENAFDKCCMLIPWKYYNERDVRTLVSFAPHIKKETPFIGTKHNPVDDCLHQIKYCSKIWNMLKPSFDL